MWYKTGTVSFTNGSAAVTGTGTSWIINAGVGEAILAPDGNMYEIAGVSSNTSITLASAYLGTTQADASYAILPTQSYIRDLAAQAASLVNSYGSLYNSVGQGDFADGALATPGISFSGDQDTGLFRSGANEVTLVANGIAVAKWSATGFTVLSGSAPIVSAKIGPSAAQQHTLPAVASDTVTLNAAGQTLTNKAINASTFNGTIGATTPSTASFTTATITNLAANTLIKSEGGSEGGQIMFEKPVSGTTLTNHVAVDIAANVFRVFENGGTSRGAALDLSMCSASAASLIVTHNTTQTLSNKTLASPVISGTVSQANFPITTGTGLQYQYCGSDHIAQYKKTGTYSWYWRKSDTGLAGGANEASLMELSNAGVLTIVSPTGGIGYSAGSGGAVTQATSKSTTVTLNKPSGKITLYGVNDANGQLAANTSTSFQLNNSLLTANDGLLLSIAYTGQNSTYYTVWVGSVSAGVAVISIRNMSAGTLFDAVQINFQIIKGAVA